MQRVQRKFGRFLPRTPNDADIDAMLRDFNDSDEMLTKIESAAKAWRDAWTNILAHQTVAAEQLYVIYKPLGAAGEGYNSRKPAETPPATLERAKELVNAFTELKTDMMEEIKEIDQKLITPAKTARESLKPMKKTIKLREDRKLDYERYKSRCEALQKKDKRSDRENIALSKHESDLAASSHEFELADENLRSQLPRLNAATFSLLPHLLANQIMLQNNLIGNLYTVFLQYSQDHGFPNPPPEPEEVIPAWEGEFTSLRKEMETSMELLRTGKAVHQPMRLPDQGSSLTGLGIRNKVIPGRQKSAPSVTTSVSARSPRPSYSSPPLESTENEAPPPYNMSSRPSLQSLNASKPKIGSTSPNPGLTPALASGARRTSDSASYNGSTAAAEDYFGRSSTSPNPAAGKKKPPPPPPKKIGSFHGEYVTAMYDFHAEGQGDLSFREGDRIRVVKKTGSSQDWWEGELRGERGSFPANYCK